MCWGLVLSILHFIAEQKKRCVEGVLLQGREKGGGETDSPERVEVEQAGGREGSGHAWWDWDIFVTHDPEDC